MHCFAIRILLFVFIALGVSASNTEEPITPIAEKPPAERKTPLKVGDTAPNFRLKDQNNADHTLDILLKENQRVALVFYRSADW